MSRLMSRAQTVTVEDIKRFNNFDIEPPIQSAQLNTMSSAALKLKKVDQFGSMFNMRLEDGQTSKNSIIGSLMSILFFIVLGSYTLIKFDVLYNRKRDVDVISTVNDMFYDFNDQFNHRQNGFNFAVAFSAYDNDPEPRLDPSYGKLQFNHYEWGTNNTSGRNPMKSVHTCTQKELGIEYDPEETKFYPVVDQNKSILKHLSKKFQCVDEKDLYLQGDYDSDVASLFNVQLKKCVNNTDEAEAPVCKSDEEIIEFFRNKFLIIFSNQIRFDYREIGMDSINMESRIQWININTQTRMSINYEVARTKLMLQDSNINLDDITELEDDTVFKIREKV